MTNSPTTKDLGIAMDELDRIRRKKMEELRKTLGNDRRKVKIEVDDANFAEEVVEQSRSIPVVVDFWAEWCMPCLMLGPILEKIAGEYKGGFILAKMNVDRSPVMSMQYGINNIPAVKMFRDGKVNDEFIGALPESSVRSWIEKNLGSR